MEYIYRIINRLEMMAADESNLKRNFEREGVVAAEVSFSNDPKMVQFRFHIA